MTNAEARFNNSLRPRKPEGSLGRTAKDGHLDSHIAPELCVPLCLSFCLSLTEVDVTRWRLFLFANLCVMLSCVRVTRIYLFLCARFLCYDLLTPRNLKMLMT